MAGPLDENFFYNSMLAKSLVQFISPNERKILRAWFSKLLTMDTDMSDKEIRNEYMWFILLMLQCQKIREPFNSLPPPDIGALRDVVSSKVYEEILVSNDDNMTWLNKPQDEKSVRFRHTAPSKFFYNQPTPPEGIICYMSAFSDRGI